MVLSCTEKGMGDFNNCAHAPVFRIGAANGKNCDEKSIDLFSEGNKVGHYRSNEESNGSNKKFIPYNSNKLSFFGEISKFQIFEIGRDKKGNRQNDKSEKSGEKKNFLYEQDAEEVQFRNGVTGKYVQGKFGGKYITGNSKYVNDESRRKREFIKGRNVSDKFIQSTIYGSEVSERGEECGKFAVNCCSEEDTVKESETNISKKLEEDEVSLFPLQNQVGGHTRLLLLNQSTICKPLNPRELNFYRNLPRDIQIFVPEYKGKLTYRFRSRTVVVGYLKRAKQVW